MSNNFFLSNMICGICVRHDMWYLSPMGVFSNLIVTGEFLFPLSPSHILLYQMITPMSSFFSATLKTIWENESELPAASSVIPSSSSRSSLGFDLTFCSVSSSTWDHLTLDQHSRTSLSMILY